MDWCASPVSDNLCPRLSMDSFDWDIASPYGIFMFGARKLHLSTIHDKCPSKARRGFETLPWEV